MSPFESLNRVVQGSPTLRSLMWRLGRRLYIGARGDCPNDPGRNGEYWLLNEVFKISAAGQILLDIGANRGDWTAEAIRQAGHGARLRIHAFEPSPGTSASLAARFAASSEVSVHAQALSDTAGRAPFYSAGVGAGTNSLTPADGHAADDVEVTTVDSFLEGAAIGPVDMAKIDAEGFDLLVLKGAGDALAAGRIGIVQFEYNWRWLMNHASLRDVFTLIEDKPYRLGKLRESGVEFYAAWHFELDKFFEGNYVLARNDIATRLGPLCHVDGANVVRPGPARSGS